MRPRARRPARTGPCARGGLRPARAGLLALLACAVLALQMPPAGAPFALGASPGAIDAGILARGATFDTTVTVRGGGDTSADITITFEGETDGWSADRSAATLAPGDALEIGLRLVVPSDAVPGRHEPRLVVAETAQGTGSSAVGAVRVPLVYRVGATDVAVAVPVNDTAVYLRIVNGHGAARTIVGNVSTTSHGSVIERWDLASEVLGAQMSRHLTVAFNTSRYADALYGLKVEGIATPTSGAAEPFDALYDLRVQGGVFAVAEPQAAAGGGGGGGGGGGAGPNAPGGAAGDDVGDLGPVPLGPAPPPAAPERAPRDPSTGTRDEAGRSGSDPGRPRADPDPFGRPLNAVEQRAVVVLAAVAFAAAAAYVTVRFRPGAP